MRTPITRMVRASTGAALPSRGPVGSSTPSTRRCGVSRRQDVLGRVQIAVVSLIALWASPSANAEREFLKDMAAGVASFAGRVEAVDDPEIPSIPLALVLQHREELPESRIGQGAGKGVVLAHPAHVEILNADCIEAPDDAGGNFVEVIGPGISDPGMETGYSETLGFPTIRSFFLPRQLFLSLGEPFLGCLKMPRVFDLLPRGERSQRCDTQVDANGGDDGRQRGNGLIKAEGNKVPFSGIFSYGDGRGEGRELPGPSDLQPPDPRQRKVLILDVPLEGRPAVFSRLAVGFFLECRITRLTFKECNESSLEMPEGLLRRNARDFIEPSMAGGLFESGEPGAGLVVTDGYTILKVSVGSHSESPVVDVPAGSEDAGQSSPLGLGRVEPKLVSYLHKTDHNLVRR